MVTINMRPVCDDEDYIILVPKYFENIIREVLIKHYNESNEHYSTRITPYPVVFGIDDKKYFLETKLIREDLKKEKELEELI